MPIAPEQGASAFLFSLPLTIINYQNLGINIGLENISLLILTPFIYEQT